MPPAAQADAPAHQMSGYFPSRRTEAKAPGKASMLTFALFVFFIMTRALHPLFIDMSKTDGKILYAKNTPVALNKLLTVVLMNVLALMQGGMDGVRQCWQPQCLVVFGLIGTIYALGDFLEMLSMSSMSGGVYQVLLQTKLLITACMVWWLKGTRQSQLQWHVLFTMFIATSVFVIVDQGSSEGGVGGDVPLTAVMTVMLKVAVSCYCAVLSEKYLKAYADMPLFAKISCLSTTWALASMLMCATERQVAVSGFFYHWDGMTWIVTASFVVKTVSTMYLLQALDSVQKNIGEALAVIVIYGMQVTMAHFNKAFQLSGLLLAVLVVMLVKTYLLSSPAKKSDRRPLPGGWLSKRMKIVALDHQGTEKMRNMGIQTVTCKAEEGLPEGVFYGLLGDVHPFCGQACPHDAQRCELMLLSKPHDSEPHNSDGYEAPHMPSDTMTVLGQVRTALPDGDLTSAQFLRDADEARARLVERLAQGPQGP